MSRLKKLVRLRKWELEEKRRFLADLEGRRAAFEAQIIDLDAALISEGEVASGSFEAASAFANFAQSIRHRQAAIRRSISELEAELEAAREANVAAFREWKRVDVLRARQMAEEAAARSRREQMDLDELALRRHRSQ